MKEYKGMYAKIPADMLEELIQIKTQFSMVLNFFMSNEYGLYKENFEYMTGITIPKKDDKGNDEQLPM